MALRKAYQEQLQTLHDELSEMGSLCILSVQLAVQAITTGEEKLTARTVETNGIIDKSERDIESLCLKLLLQQQPVAADLRRISSAMKMVYDLHRIGEVSADIADISRFVVLQNDQAADDIRRMSTEAIKMVNDSIHAFIQNDLTLARQVMTWDDIVDDWFVRTKDDLVTAITEASADAEYCLEALMAAKYLEKIGDHAENVAGWVEYSITGQLPGGESAQPT